MYVSEAVETEITTGVSLRHRKRMTERFLKGPISMRDISVASRMNGKTLAVFLALVHRRDLTGKDELTLPASLLSDLGVSRDTKAKCLRDLEAAGLIEVSRAAGKSARIKLRRSAS